MHRELAGPVLVDTGEFPYGDYLFAPASGGTAAFGEVETIALSLIEVRIMASGHIATTQPDDPGGIINAFAVVLKDQGVSEVESIVGFRQDGFVSVWTVVNDADQSVRMRIYHAELEILDRYEDVRISFHLIRRKDRPLSRIISLPRRRITVNLHTPNAR